MQMGRTKTGTERGRENRPVVLLQSLHQVAAALDVSPFDVRVEAGAQRELEGLAGDGPRRALHVEVAAGETLVEVALLQVQPDGGHEPTGCLAATQRDQTKSNRSWSLREQRRSKAAAHRAKLMANRGSWTSSVSRCCATMACIFMRLFSVAFCSITVSVGDSSWRHRRDCTDSRNSVYRLFLSASAFPQFKLVYA